MQDFIAGAFFADDRIVWDVLPYSPSKKPSFPQHLKDHTWVNENRIIKLRGHAYDGTATKPSFVACLEASLMHIRDEIARQHGRLKFFCIAMPGPIRGSGQSGAQSDEIVTAEFHRRGSDWEGIVVEGEFKELLGEFCFNSIIDPVIAENKSLPIGAFTDAAAYAVGDYHVDFEQNSKEGDIGKHETYVHITVDEGVGGAVVLDGNLLPMRLHAELGHIPVLRHKTELSAITGICRAHSFQGCLESYASLPSLRLRWGPAVVRDMNSWTPDDPRLCLIAQYLAQICVHLILSYNATKIRFSGRVTRNPALIEKVREYTKLSLDIPSSTEKGTQGRFPGYSALQTDHGFERLINPTKELHAGIYGCLLLAYDSIRRE